MDKEEKGIPRENREGKGFPIIPCPCPPYRAAPYMAIYARMHAPSLPPYMAMYARMHALLLPHCCPIAAPMGPMYAPIYSYICAYACPIAAPMWPIYARMHAPLSGTKIRTIRKAVKRQALYLIWTSAAIGHVLEQ